MPSTSVRPIFRYYEIVIEGDGSMGIRRRYLGVAVGAALLAVTSCTPAPTLRCNQDTRYLTCYDKPSGVAVMAVDSGEIFFNSRSGQSAPGAADNRWNYVAFDMETRETQLLPSQPRGPIYDVSDDGAYFLTGTDSYPNEKYLYERATGNSHLITAPPNGSDAWLPAMSNDGLTDAYSSTANVVAGDPDTEGSLDVYVYSSATSSVRRLTDGTGNGGYVAAISGDGGRVLTYQRGESENKVRVFDIDTGAVLASYADSAYYLVNATLDFDGSTAVVGGYSDTIGSPINVPQQFALVRLDVDSGTQYHLGRPDRASGKAVLSDDGSVYSYYRREIYSVDTTSGTAAQLTTGLGDEGSTSKGVRHIDIDRNNPANAVGVVHQLSEIQVEWILPHNQIFWTQG